MSATSINLAKLHPASDPRNDQILAIDKTSRWRKASSHLVGAVSREALTAKVRDHPWRNARQG